MRNVSEFIRQLKRATGADDMYVVLILAAMMADYQEKTSPWKSVSYTHLTLPTT